MICFLASIESEYESILTGTASPEKFDAMSNGPTDRFQFRRGQNYVTICDVTNDRLISDAMRD